MKKRYFNEQPDYTILRTKNGRPFFAHTETLFFSGSHTKKYCITVMAEKNIAVDIEQCRPKHFQAIAEYAFTATEQDQLTQSTAIEKDFFLLWTIKEADIKLHDGSVFSIKDSVHINLPEGTAVKDTAADNTAYPHSIFSFYLTKASEEQTEHFVVSIIIAGQDTNIEFEWHEPTETHTRITAERIFAYPAQRA
ncbi:4'-phosphopantetheinyl transferase superfamily protein [Treponema medium]|nr:4'-phosphopantetheinyl transferase superfamily protein [Treponema medium]QSH96869.1 4'-phosphopantetheinyl transferase superfamily protein [Treponema medium]